MDATADFITDAAAHSSADAIDSAIATLSTADFTTDAAAHSSVTAFRATIVDMDTDDLFEKRDSVVTALLPMLKSFATMPLAALAACEMIRHIQCTYEDFYCFSGLCEAIKNIVVSESSKARRVDTKLLEFCFDIAADISTSEMTLDVIAHGLLLSTIYNDHELTATVMQHLMESLHADDVDRNYVLTIALSYGGVFHVLRAMKTCNIYTLENCVFILKCFATTRYFTVVWEEHRAAYDRLLSIMKKEAYSAKPDARSVRVSMDGLKVFQKSISIDTLDAITKLLKRPDCEGYAVSVYNLLAEIEPMLHDYDAIMTSILMCLEHVLTAGFYGSSVVKDCVFSLLCKALKRRTFSLALKLVKHEGESLERSFMYAACNSLDSSAACDFVRDLLSTPAMELRVLSCGVLYHALHMLKQKPPVNVVVICGILKKVISGSADVVDQVRFLKGVSVLKTLSEDAAFETAAKPVYEMVKP